MGFVKPAPSTPVGTDLPVSQSALGNLNGTAQAVSALKAFTSSKTLAFLATPTAFTTQRPRPATARQVTSATSNSARLATLPARLARKQAPAAALPAQLESLSTLECA